MMSREDYAKPQEDSGVLGFRVAWNDGSEQMVMDLINLKNIFAAQLPKMPKEYIVRLVLDRNHRSMCILKKNRVIGGICFRIFPTQGFAEIVFCAITSTEQVKGYGTRIMNHLKEHVKTEKLEYFLTYADNYAIGYFRKQGFTQEISMPKERWKGWIKDYDGGTLMECRISQNVNYLDIKGMVRRQREFLFEKIKTVSNSHKVYPGLSFAMYDGGRLKPEDIPGVMEAGWQRPTKSQDHRIGILTHDTPLAQLQAKLGAVLKLMKQSKDAWPFKTAVDAKLVPDYYTVIKEPMDLEEMSKRHNKGYYTTKELFVTDMMLIVNNCKDYNTPETAYYRCAKEIEVQFQQALKDFDM